MKSNGINNVIVKPTERIIIDLQYLKANQVKQLIKMFDSPGIYAENFSALKAITRGLYKIIDDTKALPGSQVSRLFQTVNNLQGILLLDDMQEVDRILYENKLMPDPWQGFRSRRGGKSCTL